MFALLLILVMVMYFLFYLMISYNIVYVTSNFKQSSLASVGGGVLAGLSMGFLLMPFGLDRPSPRLGLFRKIGLGLVFLQLVVLIPVFIWAVPVRKVYTPV